MLPIIATYWQWHTPMAVYAMKAGKYAGAEVPAAYTLEECRELVNTSEQTGIPCMMPENWSFRSENPAVPNMIRKGLFGEIMHCHALICMIALTTGSSTAAPDWIAGPPCISPSTTVTNTRLIS